jgi:hypothetical protein
MEPPKEENIRGARLHHHPEIRSIPNNCAARGAVGSDGWSLIWSRSGRVGRRKQKTFCGEKKLAVVHRQGVPIGKIQLSMTY